MENLVSDAGKYFTPLMITKTNHTPPCHLKKKITLKKYTQIQYIYI